MLETYIGHLKTTHDALLLLEACRRGKLPRVKRRLGSDERNHIQSGSVFAWDEAEAGMRRWTDGRSWSPSRVQGNFLTYRELDGKRRPPKLKIHPYHYKPNGLIKQSFCITTETHQRFHIIAYYTKADVLSGRLTVPSEDLCFSHITITQDLYPDLASHPFPSPSPPRSLASSTSSEDSGDVSPPSPLSPHPMTRILPLPLPSISIVPQEDQRQRDALFSLLRL